MAAAAGPSLLAYNVSPSPTFLNQALALALWGGFAAVAALVATPDAQPLRHAAPRHRVAAGRPRRAAGCRCSGPGGRAPCLRAWRCRPSACCWPLLLLLLSGAAVRASAQARAAVRAVLHRLGGGRRAERRPSARCRSLRRTVPDGDWIARSGLVGRAVGNLRQPNHLSSLLLWSAIAVVPLLELGRLRRGLGWALFALMSFAVVLTASRTGVLGVGLLALWGLLDRRLSRPTRVLLLLSPLLYALAWLGLAAWAEASRHAFGGETRLAEADLSGSRFGIWANTLELIRQQPWTGVGFGEFNLAWTLTPFPGRPVAFFDHTHNLPLQLAVELGLPLAGAGAGAAGGRRCGAPGAWRRGSRRRRARHAAQRLDDAVADRAAQPAGVPAVVRLLPAADAPGCSAMAWAAGAGRRPRGRAARPAHARAVRRRHAAGHRQRAGAGGLCARGADLRAAAGRHAAGSSASPRASAAGCSRTMPTTRRSPPTTASPPPTRPSRRRRTTCWTRG